MEAGRDKKHAFFLKFGLVPYRVAMRHQGHSGGSEEKNIQLLHPAKGGQKLMGQGILWGFGRYVPAPPQKNWYNIDGTSDFSDI